MSPVYIRSRIGKTGNRYLVYFRRGGRGFPEEYAGSFRTQKEAKTRRDLVAGELAAGRHPSTALQALRTPTATKPGVVKTLDTFIRDRLVTTSPATVYIARDKDGNCLYVGITGRNIRRMHAHAKAAKWWTSAASFELQHEPTRERAEARERQLIRELQPEFNIVYSTRKAA